MVINSNLSRLVLVPGVALAGWAGGANLLLGVANSMLQEVDEVRRAKLSKPGKRLGSGIDRLVQNLLGDPIQGQSS